MSFWRNPHGVVASLLALLLALALAGCTQYAPWLAATPPPTSPPAKLEGDLPPEVPKPHYYPERVVTLLLPSPRGTAMDRVTRSLVSVMEKGMGQPLVVANRNADGLDAWSEFKRAKPDGYTLAVVSSPEVHVALHGRQEKPPFVLADFDFLAGHAQPPLALMVPAWGPFGGIEQWVQGAAAQPDKISLAIRSDSAAEILGAMDLQRQTGVRLQLQKYPNTNELITATMNGEVATVLGNINALAPTVRAGYGRFLAVLAETRSGDYPQVPTLKEKGIGVISQPSMGYAVPRDTAGEIVGYLTWTLYRAMSDPQHQTEMRAAGLPMQFTNGKEYARSLAAGGERVKPLLPLKP